MVVDQVVYTHSKGWSKDSTYVNDSCDLVYVFGSRDLLEDQSKLDYLHKIFPKSKFIGCSTAGEIYGTSLMDDTIVATAICFQTTSVRSFYTDIKDRTKSHDTGVAIAKAFEPENLKHLFIISDGININGDELVKGITNNIPSHVNVTGGLAGDAGKFEKTLVISDDTVSSNIVSAIGFYGDDLIVGYASLGGWDSFGPIRVITKSKDNVLYELDDKPALDIYIKYLGDYAKGLPANGLLFPLSIKKSLHDEEIVRTLLSIDENEGSMIFAGNMPQGSYSQFMKANFDRLIDGAVGAATNCTSIYSVKFVPELAILISCFGRKMILKQRVEEEVEAVKDVFSESTALSGFYSYGEISPVVNGTKCLLHNQTMTITAFSEK